MKISLEKLYQKAASRPPGYLEDVLAAGTLREDGFLHLSEASARALHAKYSPGVPTPLAPRKSSVVNRKLAGLGDAVALIAKPIARAIDRVAGTKLEGCKPCAKRQAKLNSLVPFGSQPKH